MNIFHAYIEKFREVKAGISAVTIKKIKIISAIILVIALGTGVAVLAQMNKFKTTNDEYAGENEDETVTEIDSSYEIAADESQILEEVETEIPEQEKILAPSVETENLYVTVPTDSMSLRSTPGFGSDVLTELEAGVYLICDGEIVTVNGNGFYKVTIRDTGESGYLPASYCVKVRYEYDDAALDIVETTDALYTYDMMVNDMETLTLKYPNIISYEPLGESLDGRIIYVIKFGNPDAKNNIMIQSTIHGREYMNSQLIMKMIEYYAYYYDTGLYDGISYKELFDNTCFYIVPMVNPDGVTISQLGVDGLNNDKYKDLVEECYERDKYYLVYTQDSQGDMYWEDWYRARGFVREALGDVPEITLEQYTGMWKANAEGVDLNRNFDADWENTDEKSQPSYGSFKGYSANSEPETQALVKLSLERDYVYFINYHSKGNIIYYGSTGIDSNTKIESQNLATMLEKFIKYMKVDSGATASTTMGGFNDYVQLCLNQVGITIESGKHRCPLSISEFKSIWLRHRESWAMIARTLY